MSSIFAFSKTLSYKCIWGPVTCVLSAISDLRQQDGRWERAAKSHGVTSVTACLVSFLMAFTVCYCRPRKWHQKAYEACCDVRNTMRFCRPLPSAILLPKVAIVKEAYQSYCSLLLIGRLKIRGRTDKHLWRQL